MKNRKRVVSMGVSIGLLAGLSFLGLGGLLSTRDSQSRLINHGGALVAVTWIIRKAFRRTTAPGLQGRPGRLLPESGVLMNLRATFVFFGLLGLLCLMLPGSLRADTVYTYTGNPYTNCFGTYTCNGTTPALSFTFDTKLTGAQLDNLVLGTVAGGNLTASVASFSFTDGTGLSINQANTTSSTTVFDVTTDSHGNILNWFFFTQTLVPNPTNQLQAAETCNQCGGNPSAFDLTNGPTGSGYVFNNPGTWVVTTTPTITTCASGFFGRDVVINNLAPHDAFIPALSVVKHFSSVVPGSGECSFGAPLPDISLGAGMSDSWGVALDNLGNLFVAAGSNDAAITEILEIEPPYTGPPTIFYSAATNLRSMAIHGSILYAVDSGTGAILRFDLGVGPSSVRTFATVPGVFGIVAVGADDVFVTSNGGAGGTNDVKHVARTRVGVGIRTVATGLSLPEGIGNGAGNLYIAAGGVVFTVPASGGTPTFYAGSPIEFSHGVTVWKDGGYVTDSHAPGEVHKFTLL